MTTSPLPHESQPATAGKPPQTILVVQMIVGSMLVGLLTMSIVAAFVGASPTGPAASGGSANFGFVVSMGLGLTAVMSLAWLVVPGLAVAEARRRVRVLISSAQSRGEQPSGTEIGEAIFAVYSNAAITRVAFVEGAGLLCAVSVLLTNNPLGFAGVGVAMLLIVAGFPTAGRAATMARRIAA